MGVGRTVWTLDRHQIHTVAPVVRWLEGRGVAGEQFIILFQMSQSLCTSGCYHMPNYS